jgi:hypothetical protein
VAREKNVWRAATHGGSGADVEVVLLERFLFPFGGAAGAHIWHLASSVPPRVDLQSQAQGTAGTRPLQFSSTRASSSVEDLSHGDCPSFGMAGNSGKACNAEIVESG